MIGHQQVIALRRAGAKPDSVWIYVGSYPDVRYPWQEPERQIDWGEHATVYTGFHFPDKFDLRWLHGLLVYLLADDYPSGFRSWWNAIAEHRPQRMFGIDDNGRHQEWQQ